MSRWEVHIQNAAAHRHPLESAQGRAGLGRQPDGGKKKGAVRFAVWN
jgi:hypothetical protein